jgi:hypothetical protein
MSAEHGKSEEREIGFNLATVKSLATAEAERVRNDKEYPDPELISLANMPIKDLSYSPVDEIKKANYEQFVARRAQILKDLATKSFEGSKHFGKDPVPQIAAIAEMPVDTLIETLQRLDRK